MDNAFGCFQPEVSTSTCEDVMKRIHRISSLLINRSKFALKGCPRASKRKRIRSLETLETRNLMSASPWQQPNISLIEPAVIESPAIVSLEYATLPVSPPQIVPLPAGPATPPDGSLDRSFSNDGNTHTNFSGSDFAKAVAVDSKGRTIVVGRGDDDFGVARYLADGRLDKSFGKEGKVRINFAGVDTANDVVILSDGRILVVGAANNEQDFGMAMLKADGSLDRSFGVNGKVLTNFSGTDYAEAVAVDGAGRIVVVGNGGSDFGIARYLANGKLDTTFKSSSVMSAPGTVRVNIAGVDAAKDLRILPDGRILVVGAANNQQDFGMIVLKTDGSLDKSFGTGGMVVTNFSGTDYAEAVTIDSRGRIVVVGNGGNDFGIARYLANGQLDISFGSSKDFAEPGKVRVNFGGVDVAKDVIALPDGRILVVGAANNQRDTGMVMLTEHGTLDPTFGKGGKVISYSSGTDTGEGFTLDNQGRIIVVGRGDGDFGVSRYNLTPRFPLLLTLPTGNLAGVPREANGPSMAVMEQSAVTSVACAVSFKTTMDASASDSDSATAESSTQLDVASLTDTRFELWMKSDDRRW
jgi:uncharacterized delta-60 repeat protein